MTDASGVLPVGLPADLLEYRFSTLPSPLQVSTASSASPGAINLWLSPAAGRTVYCSKILIAVPIGGDETDLCEHAPSLTPNTTWWAMSSLKRESGEALGLVATAEYAVFTAVCTSNAHWKIDYDLQFSLITGAVNRKEGTIGLVIAETSGETERTLQQRRTVFGLDKTPATDYLSGVVTTAAPPAATDTPTSEFTAGQAIRLAWESNASTFAVYVSSDPAPIWTGTDTSYVIRQGVTCDSTFSVVATGMSASRIATATVTVTNPTIAPTSLSAGELAVSGPSALAGTALASLAAQTLGVSGLSTLPAGLQAASWGASGATSLSGGLTAANLSVTGTLAAASAATVQAATVAQLTVTARTSLVGAQAIGEGTYTADTDGFVVGYVGAPTDQGKRCAGLVVGQTAGVGKLAAHGGNGMYWASGKDSSMGPVYGSFLMPIQRRVPFSVGCAQLGGAEVAAPTAFLWMPLGSNGQLTALTTEEATASGIEPLVVAQPVEVEAPKIGRDLDSLVGFLADVLGERLTPDQTERLRTAVVALTARPYSSNHPRFGASS